MKRGWVHAYMIQIPQILWNVCLSQCRIVHIHHADASQSADLQIYMTAVWYVSTVRKILF